MSQDPGDGGSHPQAGRGQRAAQMQVRYDAARAGALTKLHF